tara:strand:+ start:550 stop:966 length:417 start_codon:yes stop_codon:yes gene_type:complete
MAGAVAQVIRLEFEAGRISTLYGLEGVLRAALRSSLCLLGWHWGDAQQAATDIVGAAHSLLGAERPDWYEGQPEYVVAEDLLIERTRCRRCHKPLQGNCRKYCSALCRSGHHHALNRIREASAEMTIDMVVRSVWRAS